MCAPSFRFKRAIEESCMYLQICLYGNAARRRKVEADGIKASRAIAPDADIKCFNEQRATDGPYKIPV